MILETGGEDVPFSRAAELSPLLPSESESDLAWQARSSARLTHFVLPVGALLPGGRGMEKS